MRNGGIALQKSVCWGRCREMSPQVQEDALPTYTREEVAKHKKFTDCWVVVHGQVYDVTKWLPRHPGGARLLMHYAGEDATVSSITALQLCS